LIDSSFPPSLHVVLCFSLQVMKQQVAGLAVVESAAEEIINKQANVVIGAAVSHLSESFHHHRHYHHP